MSFLASLLIASILGTILSLNHSFESLLAKAIFWTQITGWIAVASIWGVHGGGGSYLTGIVFVAANTIVYFPIAFLLTYWLRGHKPSAEGAKQG